MKVFIITMSKNKKNINRIVILNIISTFIIKIVSIITAPIISRLLGTNGYGIISVYTTCVSFISIIFGLQTVSTFAIARNEYPLESQMEYQSSCLGLTICSFSIFSVIMLVINEFLPVGWKVDSFILTLAIIHSFGENCINLINTKFTYEYEAGKNLIISLLTTICISVLSILLILALPDQYKYYGRILGFVTIYALSGIFTIIYIFKKGKVFFNKKYWLFCLSLSIPVIAHNLSSIVMGHCDVLMLDKMMDHSVVGIYSLAASFCGILLSIQTALDKSWLPFYFDYLREKEIKRIRIHAANYLIVFTGVVIGFILLSIPVYRVFASHDYWIGEEYITWFVLGYYFSFLYSFPVNFEFFSKNTKLIAVNTFLSAVINVLLNYFMIVKFGAMGAVIATGLSNILLFLFHHYTAKHLIQTEMYPLSLSFFLPYILFIVMFLCLYRLIRYKYYACVILAVLDGLYLVYRTIKNKSIL